MAVSFTQGNDFIVPTEDGQNYLGGAGNDTYMLSDATIAANSTIVIQDTEGTNTIQLVGGLSIASSIVTSNALELTLSNGAKVQILGANSFGYDVGGNALAGVDGTDQTFTELVENTLGTTVPATGSSTGGAVEVPDSTAPATPTFSVSAAAASVTEGGSATFTVSLSSAQGTAQTVAYTLAGTGGAVLGTDTTTVANATLTFAPGETTKTITVPVTFDTTVETGEGMTLTLSAPSTGTTLGTSSAAVAFADPAAPTFTLTSNVTAGVASEEGTTITYTITPSSMTDKAYNFTLSTAGDSTNTTVTSATASDFSPASKTVSFAAGTTTPVTVVQTIVNDSTSEGLEVYKTNLLDSSLTAIASVTGLINDPVSGGEGTVGTTYTLLTTADNIPGTTGNDVINGYVNTTAASTSSTLTAADTIDGGAGTADVLAFTVEGNVAATFPAATISNVEIFKVRDLNTVGASTYSFSGVTGEKNAVSDRSTQNVAFTNLGTGAAADINGDGSVVAGTTAFGYAIASDAATLNLTNGVGLATTTTVTPAGAVTISTAPTAVTVNSTGASNYITSLALGGSATGLTINAATYVSTGNITGFTGTGKAITLTGANSANIGTLENTTVGSVNAAGMTAGGVTATLNTNTTIAVVGGQGNDSITTGSVLTTGTVDAGAGTGDKLTVADSTHLASTTLGAKYTNFETLGIVNGVLVDMDNISGITSVVMTDGASTATELRDMSATQAAAVTLTDLEGAAILTVKNAATVGQLDTVSITVSDGDTITSETISTTAGDLTIADVETINFIATDDLALSTLANMNEFTVIGVSGVGDAGIYTGNTAVVLNASINGSTSTGIVKLSAAQATTNGMGLQGGLNNDQLTGSAQADALTGNAGNDVLLGLAGADVLSGGDGNDVLDGGAGADTMTGGAGGDSFGITYDGATTVDTITDLVFGTDKLLVTTAPSAVNTTVFAATGADLATAAAGAGTNFGANTAGIFTYSSNTYLLISDATPGTIAATDSIVKINGYTGTIATTDFTTTGATITTVANGTETVAGTGGVDIITGGTGVDTIDGGDGADTITGGAGADTMTGGTGADIIKWTATTAALMGTETGVTAGTDVDFVAGTSGDKIVGFATGTDKFHFAAAALTNALGTEADTLKTIAAAGTVADTDRFVEITTAQADGEMGTAITLLNGLTTVAVAIGDSFVAFINDGTHGYLYMVEQVSVADTIAAQDVTLLGQVTSVTDVADGDFVSFSSAKEIGVSVRIIKRPFLQKP